MRADEATGHCTRIGRTEVGVANLQSMDDLGFAECYSVAQRPTASLVWTYTCYPDFGCGNDPNIRLGRLPTTRIFLLRFFIRNRPAG